MKSSKFIKMLCTAQNTEGVEKEKPPSESYPSPDMVVDFDTAAFLFHFEPPHHYILKVGSNPMVSARCRQMPVAEKNRQAKTLHV